MRIDKFLYENGFAESRQKAQRMIENGNCLVNGRVIIKSSFDVCSEDCIEISGETLKYVGRGGLKLEKALEFFEINVSGLVCADIGASTGGFTDCLLFNGAQKVFALDCGSGQLHPKLRADDRVINIEKFNARELTLETLGEYVDIAVMDVSFISQTALHFPVASVLKESGIFISLIKPQFEAGKEYVGKGGIIRDSSVYKSVIEKVVSSAKSCGLEFVGYTESPIKGGDGNTEFVSCFVKNKLPKGMNI